MKILVTGGAGFIGGNFVHHMVEKYPDYEIVNLDLLTYAGNLETLKPVEDKPNYKFVKGDIADEPFMMDLFEKEVCGRDSRGPLYRRPGNLCSFQCYGGEGAFGCLQKIWGEALPSGFH